VTSVRNRIVDAFRAALDAVRPDSAVARTLARTPSGELLVNGTSLGQVVHVETIAVGKAAVAMTSGALDALGDVVRRGFVITKDGHVDRELPRSVEVHEAAHPVLDKRSVEATHRLLQWVADIPSNATVICLISGGGSALLEEPIDGISLAEFQEMTRLLLRAGADIFQLNAVRSQLSRVKGGGLRAAIAAKRVVTLALSDVLGNDPTVIASGPTVPLSTSRQDARVVLSRLGLSEQMPANVRRALASAEIEKHGTYPEDIVAIIADNRLAVTAAADSLRKNNFRVRVDDEPYTGEARDIAVEWVRRLPDLATDVDAVLAGGELTVTVNGNGIGGRNTEFALAAALELERLGIADWAIASLATDGDDGPTEVAGAIVDRHTPAKMRGVGFDPLAALRNNDSFPGLARIGAVVDTGPTGTNVNDLYFAVRTEPD